MEPVRKTSELEFYYEANRDPRKAQHLCVELSLKWLNDFMRTDVGTNGGFDPDTLGLMGLMGINPIDFLYYDAGTFWISVPEDVTKLRQKLGPEINTAQIVDYVFRSSVGLLIDKIDGTFETPLFEDINKVVKGERIDPSWVYEVILDRLVYPQVAIDNKTMEDIMPLLAEIYVALIAYDPEG